MSISRQIMIFTASMVILAMLVLYTISSMVFKELQLNTAFNYLQTTSYVAESLIEERLAEMSNSGVLAARAFDLPAALDSGDRDRLMDCLLYLRGACPFLSFALFTDRQGDGVASFPAPGDGAALLFRDNLEEMRASGQTALTTSAVLPLSGLFGEGAGASERYAVRLEDGTLMGHALANLAITAVGESGYLILGEIINNSAYYPDRYSATIDNSFLSISLGDIRVCSNIASPERDDYLGCPIPDFNDNFKAKADYYYGVEYAPIGDDYYFSYKAIRNHPGEIIGYLGVGIPERDYKLLLKSNTFIILVVILISLPVILISSWLFCNRITRPIIASMNISQRITRGDFSAGEEYPVPEHPRSEPAAPSGVRRLYPDCVIISLRIAKCKPVLIGFQRPEICRGGGGA